MENGKHTIGIHISLVHSSSFICCVCVCKELQDRDQGHAAAAADQHAVGARQATRPDGAVALQGRVVRGNGRGRSDAHRLSLQEGARPVLQGESGRAVHAPQPLRADVQRHAGRGRRARQVGHTLRPAADDHLGALVAARDARVRQGRQEAGRPTGPTRCTARFSDRSRSHAGYSSIRSRKATSPTT